MSTPLSGTAGSRHALGQAAAPGLRAVEIFAAILAALTALVYVLIASQVLDVVEGAVDMTWALGAGAAYALGTVLLLAVRRRIVWVLGALLQAFVIFTYFSVASQRVPAYEVWGILLRVMQALIFISLAWLTLRRPRPEALARF